MTGPEGIAYWALDVFLVILAVGLLAFPRGVVRFVARARGRLGLPSAADVLAARASGFVVVMLAVVGVFNAVRQ